MIRLLFAIILFLPLSSFAATPTARVEDGRIVLADVASARGLSVVIAGGTEQEIAGRPAIAGEWATVAAGGVAFSPKYPFKAGTTYRVLGLAGAIEVKTPARSLARPTALTHVYPTATQLPENVLRFYVEFDQSMPRGDAYKYVEILQADGKRIDQPFLELDEELWNADQTRLTLLIDPGRIKRDVKPREDLGPVFQAGKKYTLVVRGAWPTLDGGTLGKDVRKSIEASLAVTDGVQLKGWKIAAPAIGDRSKLEVTFPRPMDFALSMRSLSVVDGNGKAVEGVADLGEGEMRWAFRPSQAWREGAYRIRVQSLLEDVSGNGVGRPFEVETAWPEPKKIAAAPAELKFEVGRR